MNQMALGIVYCNWVRVHKTFKTTPAVAAGLAKHRWSMHWIAELAELYHETAADVAAVAAAQRDARYSIH